MILTVTLNAAIDKRYVIENFREGEVNRVKECRYVPGGKGLNVSKTAVIAGERVVATGFVGGHAGAYIEEALEKYGVEHDFFHLSGESRTCINIWDEKKQLQTECLEPGAAVSPEEFRGFLERYQKQLPKADVIVLSGSVPKGLEESTYRRLIRLGKEAGKKVILDTSGRLLEEGIKEKPYLIKPNIDEIRMLTGSACKDLAEIGKAARALQEDGIEMVVVSLGKDGAVAATKKGIFRLTVPQIQAVNTVGCGDTMTAGFAVGISRELEPEEILKRAAAMSTASALREETGYFLREDMEDILKQISLTEMQA